MSDTLEAFADQNLQMSVFEMRGLARELREIARNIPPAIETIIGPRSDAYVD